MIQSLQQIQHLYPFQSRFFSIDGKRMHYVDEGEGPPVVMVHGNPTWSFYYRELIKGLANGNRVIALDHIGCGLSEKPQRYAYTLKTHIDNLERLIEHLGLEDITLAVHDWGGAIGFGYARREPERVRRFVIFNTAAFFGPVPRRLLACRIPILGALAVRRLNLFALAATRIACKSPERMTSEVKRGYLLPYDSYRNRVAVLRFVQDIPTRPSHPSYALLESIESSLLQFRDRPMIIFWGEQDFCFNQVFLDAWIERFPQAAVHRFADAGHYVVEDAHERILPLLHEFLHAAECVAQT
jgi:haloalkane dehalogenase